MDGDMRISRPNGCDDGAHGHSERGIHQLLSGLAETLATVYRLRRELLRRGQEGLVVTFNFVFFTD
jgi:alkylhydroperoxidase family enzyme